MTYYELEQVVPPLISLTIFIFVLSLYQEITFLLIAFRPRMLIWICNILKYSDIRVREARHIKQIYVLMMHSRVN